MQESPARPEFSLEGLNDALARWDAERRVFEAAWMIAVAQGVEAGAKGSRRGPARNGLAQPEHAPVSTSSCAYASLIHSVWQRDADWAVGIAFRESRCQPSARNGSSGSAGLLQLLGHDDLLRAACPTQDPAVSWSDPYCNIKAGWLLYQGSGRPPWAL